jgi:integrase
MLTLTGSAKRVSAAWTNDGTGLDHRQLKHRARDAVRVVPIPPLLVAILREHLKHFGTATDGRLFQVTWGQRGNGGVVTAKVYGHIWQKARAAALTKTQQASPLAARPYDLRHGGITSPSTLVSQPSRSPAEPATASKSCGGSTPAASTARNDYGITGSKKP